MNTRLDLAGASVLPFQFPALEPACRAPPQENGSADPGAAPQTAADAGADEAETFAADANGRDAAAEAVAAELARGHAEGYQRGLEEGREKGHAIGFAEGTKAAEARLAEQAQRIAAILGGLDAPLQALERPVEDAVAGLALEIARCVIGTEVKHSHEFLVGLIREALAKVPVEMGAPRVILNPADLDLVRALAPEIEAVSSTLVADEAIEAGGCLVVADGDDRPIKDRRWNPRAAAGVSQVNLTLSSRWRAVMLTLFDGEDE